MTVIDAHPWVRFFTGFLTGGWVGVAVGCVVTLLFSGRRLRQLESANLLLRVKLRAHERPRRAGTNPAGPVLVVPPGGAQRAGNNPVGKVANGGPRQ
jgi:hypothetical protein